MSFMDPELLLGFAFAFMAFVVAPMVFMLLKHQQKMAELLHRHAQQAPPPTDPILLEEVRKLRELVVQQSLMLDTLTSNRVKSEGEATPEELRHRFG